MTVFWTSKWGIQPVKNEHFRIGLRIYWAVLIVGKLVLAKNVDIT